VRPDPGPANSGGNQANDSPLFLPVSSSSSSDVFDAGKGYEAIIGTLPSPIADPTESPHFRIPLAIQSPSKMNTHHRWDLGGRGSETPDIKVQKRGAPSDSEDWEHLNKKLHQASNVTEWLKATEDRKCRAQFDDKKGDEYGCPVQTLLLTLSVECGRSECLTARHLYAKSTKTYISDFNFCSIDFIE